ncbi:hypothetical protein [Algicola sagamiensis]|uniref:hypothetical protein n=1 Tax=Algicola sagamiensis TaxID=163869 RepID=UPI0003A13D18|nr:hypothetical protein [Algicola sagamiensis]
MELFHFFQEGHLRGIKLGSLETDVYRVFTSCEIDKLPMDDIGDLYTLVIKPAEFHIFEGVVTNIIIQPGYANPKEPLFLSGDVFATDNHLTKPEAMKMMDDVGIKNWAIPSMTEGVKLLMTEGHASLEFLPNKDEFHLERIHLA